VGQGKGRKPRRLRFTRETRQEIQRYLLAGVDTRTPKTRLYGWASVAVSPSQGSTARWCGTASKEA